MSSHRAKQLSSSSLASHRQAPHRAAGAIFNAANINLVAFWRYGSPDPIVNQAGIVFALFVITLAAAEAAVGLALVIAIYRSRDTVNVEQIDLLKW